LTDSGFLISPDCFSYVRSLCFLFPLTTRPIFLVDAVVSNQVFQFSVLPSLSTFLSSFLPRSHSTFVIATERDFTVAVATRFDMIVFVVTFIHSSIYHYTPTIMSALATGPDMQCHERPSSKRSPSDRLNRQQFSGCLVPPTSTSLCRSSSLAHLPHLRWASSTSRSGSHLPACLPHPTSTTLCRSRSPACLLPLRWTTSTRHCPDHLLPLRWTTSTRHRYDHPLSLRCVTSTLFLVPLASISPTSQMGNPNEPLMQLAGVPSSPKKDPGVGVLNACGNCGAMTTPV
jgi:hypothetical protein